MLDLVADLRASLLEDLVVLVVVLALVDQGALVAYDVSDLPQALRHIELNACLEVLECIFQVYPEVHDSLVYLLFVCAASSSLLFFKGPALRGEPVGVSLDSLGELRQPVSEVAF